MLKLNVQQNNQNVIQAFKNALAIGNLKGIIASDGNHNFSTAGSNRNLLDNPFFTVNQREFTSVTGRNGVKTVDRWEVNNGGGTGGTISVTSEGYISLVTGSAYISYQEKFGKDELAGKTVTMSINDDGNIYSHSFTVPARTASTQTGGSFIFKAGCRCNFFVMSQSSAYGYNFQISIGTGYSATIRAVKLELGAVSTLANDGPPDYWQELDKCLYYFERVTNNGSSPITIGAGFADGVNNLYVPVHIHRKRAGIATISTSGAIYAGQRSSNISVASVTQYNSSPDGIITLLAVTPSSFTSNEYYRLALGAGAHIDFSAEP